MISYEVSFGLLVISFLCILGSFSLLDIKIEQTQSGSLIGPLVPVSFMFIVTGVAETNRAPFDLAESESELVSGFNVEYSGMAFALFFLAEYASILFF
jgi:NADH-quinone oxidoreductase subunit H